MDYLIINTVDLIIIYVYLFKSRFFLFHIYLQENEGTFFKSMI